MSVKIKLNPILARLVGGQEVIEVKGSTTGECLRNLEEQFPSIKQETRDKRGRLAAHYAIFVNSKCTYPKELTTPVKNGDEIEIGIIAIGG